MVKNTFRIVFTILVIGIIGSLILPGINSQTNNGKKITGTESEEIKKMSDKVVKTDADWCQILTEEEYRILRQRGTELPFTGTYTDFKGKGVYKCAGCGNVLFGSDTKYHSGSGWPSFWAPVSEKNIQTKEDNSLFMTRTEVVCGKCGGHLGHVFDDGPPPSGKRFCINSAALRFEAASPAGEESPQQ